MATIPLRCQHLAMQVGPLDTSDPLFWELATTYAALASARLYHLVIFPDLGQLYDLVSQVLRGGEY